MAWGISDAALRHDSNTWVWWGGGRGGGEKRQRNKLAYVKALKTAKQVQLHLLSPVKAEGLFRVH